MDHQQLAAAGLCRFATRPTPGRFVDPAGLRSFYQLIHAPGMFTEKSMPPVVALSCLCGITWQQWQLDGIPVVVTTSIQSGCREVRISWHHRRWYWQRNLLRDYHVQKHSWNLYGMEKWTSLQEENQLVDSETEGPMIINGSWCWQTINPLGRGVHHS